MTRRDQRVSAKIQRMLRQSSDLESSGHHHETDVLLSQCVKAAQRTGNALIQGSVYHNIARCLAHRGDWFEAKAAVDKAISLAKSAPPGIKSELQFLRAQILVDAGLHEQALSELRQVESLFAKLGNSKGRAFCLIKLADVLSERSRFDEALEAANLAVNLTSEDDAAGILAVRSLAKVLHKSGDLAHAETQARCALRAAEHWGDKPVLKETLVILGSILKDKASNTDRRTLNEALLLYEHALKISVELHDRSSEAQMLMNIGAVKDDLSLFEEAREMYLGALNLFENLHSPHRIAMAYLNLGTVSGRLREPGKTIEYSSMALKAFRQTGDIQRQALCLHNIGRAQIALGKFPEALDTLRECLDRFEEYRAQISSTALRREFRSRYCGVFEDLCYLCVRTGDVAKAMNYLELSKFSEAAEHLLFQSEGRESSGISPIANRRSELVAEYSRQYRRLMQEIDLETKLGWIGESDARLEKTQLSSSLQSIQEQIGELDLKIILEETRPGKALPTRSYDVVEEAMKVLPENGWLLLEFGLLSNFNQLVIFALSPKGIPELIDARNVDTNDLRSVAEAFGRAAALMAAGDWRSASDLLKEASVQSYKRLFSKPVEEVLEKLAPETLIIVPHKFLHSVAFQTLNNGTKYLIDSHVVTTSFSLDALRIQVTLSKTTSQRIERAHLTIPGPVRGDLSIESEVEMVTRTLRSVCRVASLKSSEVNRSQVVKMLQDKRWSSIHFIGHGHYAEPANASALQLHDDLLTADEIQNIRLQNAPLVVLNACSTGRSQPKAGDELLGIGRSFLMAGAANVTVTYWPVTTKIASEFSRLFYHELSSGSSVGLAFGSAIRQLKRSGLGLEDWGVFDLLGNPFTKPFEPTT